MKIGIDIDDTLTNTKELQIKYWKEYYLKNPDPNFSKEIPTNINSFGNEYISTFWDTYREALFTPPIKENASNIIKKLNQEGYQLCIITSRPDYKYHNLKERIITWLHKNNINITEINTNIRDKALFCHKNNIDLLIDDSIEHVTNTIKHNKKAILFNNIKDYQGLQTDNWLDLYNIIKKMKTSKQ